MARHGTKLIHLEENAVTSYSLLYEESGAGRGEPDDKRNQKKEGRENK
jgi:hypothetical protein